MAINNQKNYLIIKRFSMLYKYYKNKDLNVGQHQNIQNVVCKFSLGIYTSLVINMILKIPQSSFHILILPDIIMYQVLLTKGLCYILVK